MEHPQVAMLRELAAEKLRQKNMKDKESSKDSKQTKKESTDSKNPVATKIETLASPTWKDLDRLCSVLKFTADEDWSTRFISYLPKGFAIYNPSIIVHPEDPSQFLINFRAANYHVTDGYRYLVRGDYEGDSEHITTLNYLGTLPINKTKTSDVALLGALQTPSMPYPYPRIGGWEDVRLQAGFEAGDSKTEKKKKILYATFTSLEITETHMPAISLSVIDLDTKQASVPVRLKGLRPITEKEKNWMSFIWRDELHFVYSINPLRIMKADVKTGDCPIVFEHTNQFLTQEWRGSSPLLALPKDLVKLIPTSKSDDIESYDWFICLAHTSNWPKYAQLFLRFVFDRFDIEYSLGLSLTPDQKEFIMPYSRRDEQCRCVRFEPKDLLSQLCQIPKK